MKQLNRIKVVLVEQNRTAKWLSEQIGKNTCSVSRWCTNTSQPDLETLFRIAEVLNVDVRELIHVEKKIIQPISNSMAIPINIEDLLNKRKIESNRIEFKKGWNPDKIYRTICAFANDFDNIGGGYIVVGIEEEERTGIAKRPVTGVPIEALNDIQKDMVGYNNKIEPYYMPRIDVQEVDGKSVLVIWAPAGVNRPYNVRERVTAKQSPSKWYIRSGTSTIEAKGEVLDELREMANRTPFDERGNERIDISDISPALVLDYLQTVGSRLANDFESKPFVEILDQMDLLTGPTEHQTLKM